MKNLTEQELLIKSFRRSASNFIQTKVPVSSEQIDFVFNILENKAKSWLTEFSNNMLSNTPDSIDVGADIIKENLDSISAHMKSQTDNIANEFKKRMAKKEEKKKDVV